MVQDNITKYVININELLVAHEEMVKLDAHGNLLSRAVLSESFYCDFLNVLMGWKLINANIERKNAPGIDLIDETRRVAVQISLMCDHNKIQSSIDKFDKNWSKGSSGWHFYFVPLSDRVPDYKVDFDVPAGIAFDKNTDVLTKARVMALAMIPLQGEKKVDRLRSVSDILDRLMREQRELIELITHLSDSLTNIRRNHPSFRLLGNDGIDDSLLPEAPMPALGESESGEKVPVWNIIKAEDKEGFRHIIIEGDGGIGKSILLLSVTKDTELLQRIPAVYVHMYDLLNAGKHMSITDYLKDRHSGYWEAISRLAGKRGRPKLMLLLDGLNEVPLNLQYAITEDIRAWTDEHPGAQIIMASRQIPGHPLQYILGDNALAIKLKKLDWSIVTEYLSARGVSVPEENSSLGKTIVLPLFLTLYAKTANLKGRTVRGYGLSIREPKGPASLVWNYLQRELLRQRTDKAIVDCAFACEHIVPYIAFAMVQNNTFTISFGKAKELIESYDRGRAGNLPKHLSNLLAVYEDENPRYDRAAEDLQNLILKGLGLFVEVEDEKASNEKHVVNEYSFLHQNFRDCLAALHLVNVAETAEDRLPEEWKKSIRSEVLEYAAELMERSTAEKLWELNRAYKRYAGGKPKDNASTYMQLELNRCLGTPGNRLDFSGMDLRGMSLTGYMGHGCDMRLFGKPELARDAHVDRVVFEDAGHTNLVTCLAVLSDGHIASGSDDKTIRIWDAGTGECLRMLEGHTGGVTCLAVLSDGYIASGSRDKTIRIWDAGTGECLRMLEGHTGGVTCLAVLSDGRIVSIAEDHTLRIWDTDTGKCLRWLRNLRDLLNCLATLPDRRIASGSDDKTIHIWNADSGKCLRTLTGHASRVTSLAALRDGRPVSGSDDGTIRIWDADTGKCLWVLNGHTGSVTSLAAFPDGRIVSLSEDNTLRIWDADSGKCLRVFEHECFGLPNGLAVLSDGRIASSFIDFIIFRDANTGECLQAFFGQAFNQVKSVAVLHGRHIVSKSIDTIRIWDADTCECLQTLDPNNIAVCLTLLSDGRIVSGSRILDSGTGECLRVLKGHTRGVTCLTVLRNGRIVSGSADKTIRIWDADTGGCLRTLEGHTNPVTCLAVLPDGRLVSGSDDKTIRVWNADTGECLRVLEEHVFEVNSLTVLRDGRIVSGSADKTIRIWDADTGGCLRTLEGHTNPVTCLAVLPDGRLVSGSDDETIRIWNTDAGECLRTLKGHTRSVTCFAALLDGRLVSGSDDNTLRIWDPNTGECLDVLEATEVDVSRMHLSNAIMDDDTIRILYQNMAQDHGEFAKMYLRTGGNQ